MSNIWVSPFPVFKLETPTGNPKHGRLTVEIVRQAPREGYVAFTASVNGKRFTLPLVEEASVFYAEYEGRRYPVFLKVGEVACIFYVSILDLFLKVTNDMEHGG